jgi:chromosome segregation ATPase
MEFEQIIKRLDWLDEEHRKDKASIAQIMEQLSGFEASTTVLNQQIKELTKNLSSISSTAARIDQFDQALENHRAELNKYVSELERQTSRNLVESEKRHRLEFEGINRSIENLQKSSDTTEIQQKLDARILEEQRVSRYLTEMDAKLSQINTYYNDYSLSIKLNEDYHRQESKKVIDIQTDIVTLRKNIDDIKNKIDLYPDSIRRLETRLTEIVSSEGERKQSQKLFLEQQALLQIDRDQTQKELKNKIEKMGKQSQVLESQIQEWDSIHREVKHAQEVYEEISVKYERRINEITEMQRLAEDRFKQEWITFKADYQKRWTSFTMTQDEQFKDTHMDINKLAERIGPIEDLIQTQKDIIQQTKEANEEYLHGLLAQIHELLSGYERIMGQSN